jgi:hypothetical protein
MSKWIACGSPTNPKRSKEFIRFSSKLDYATQEEAEEEAQRWRKENRYAYIWVERVGA